MQEDIAMALASQARIGWYQATKGFLVTSGLSHLAMRVRYVQPDQD